VAGGHCGWQASREGRLTAAAPDGGLAAVTADPSIWQAAAAGEPHDVRLLSEQRD
jgi:hypothetical protein